MNAPQLLHLPDTLAAPAAVRAPFERLLAAFEGERDPTHAVRIDRLRRLESMVERATPAFVQAVSADFGHRPAAVTRMADLLPTLMAARHARKHLSGWMKTRRAPTGLVHRPGYNRVQRQPLGVVGIVSPWNYPVLLALGPLVAALAAGNRALLKPSEVAPRTAELLADEIAKSFSADEVAVVTGDADVARAFVALPFHHLLFTGSTAVGRHVALAAAEHLTPVTLELGGKSPAIIGSGAALERDAERIVAGKLLNAGQTCIAPDYALVPHAQIEPFIAALTRAARKQYPGTVAANADYTSIITERHHQRLLDLLDEARSAGARVQSLFAESADERASAPSANAARKLPLHVVTGAPATTRVMREEIFGPILPIVGYGAIDEAIAHVNAHDRPLALYWFGSNDTERDRVLRGTLAGGVTVNDTLWHIAQEELPFGGVGASGMGRYHGEWGFLQFSKETGVYHQSAWSGIKLVYPPYGATFEKMMGLLKRIG